MALQRLRGIESNTFGGFAEYPIMMFTILNLDGFERAARNAGICAVVFKGERWTLLKSIETALAQSQRSIQ